MAYVYDVDTQRHDQNISLWYYSNGTLLLIRYWELERITRIKHHNKAFRSKEHAIEFINLLLKEVGLSIENIVGIIGCPELGHLKIRIRRITYIITTVSVISTLHLFSILKYLKPIRFWLSVWI